MIPEIDDIIHMDNMNLDRDTVLSIYRITHIYQVNYQTQSGDPMIYFKGLCLWSRDPERVVGKEYMTAAFDSWIREASAELTLRKL